MGKQLRRWYKRIRLFLFLWGAPDFVTGDRIRRHTAWTVARIVWG